MENEAIAVNTPLYRFWEAKISVDKPYKTTSAEWDEQVCHLSRYGRGTEEALRYLIQHKPPFDEFMRWLQETLQATEVPDTDEPVFTEAELEAWHRNGYAVIKNAVSIEACIAAQNAIWDFLGASNEQPDTWYAPHAHQYGLMLSFFQHAALQANRGSARIKKAYEELYGTKDIYLLIDKVSFNPPETNGFNFKGSPLHWDVSLHPPIPYVLQGLLYLNDVAEHEGAFHCVPGFHKKIDGWLAALPENADPRALILKEAKPIPVPGKAGDLVVWHNGLPHCATANKGTMPRMVQYIAYKPLKTYSADVWR